MTCLLYCIFPGPVKATMGPPPPTGLLGVGAAPVFLVGGNGLRAAVSQVCPGGKDEAGADSTPEISHLLAYQKVVESFHENPAVPAVIPLRYGCRFEEESQVGRLLEERGPQFKTLLGELDGCAEMGITILTAEGGSPGPERNRESEIGNRKLEIVDDLRSPSNPLAHPRKRGEEPGTAYLAARRARYRMEEELAEENRGVVERSRAAFSGLYAKWGWESRATRNSQLQIRAMESDFLRHLRWAFAAPCIRLYFLVPRSSIELFRRVFQQVRRQEAGRILLSGPWPPYNFVVGDPDSLKNSRGQAPLPPSARLA